MIGDLRHERCSDCLEEECDSDIEASEICTKTEAQGQDAGEEGDHGEEQRDDVEGPHEPAQVIELVGAHKLFRNVGLGAKVARWVEGQRSLRSTAVSIASFLFTAKRKESPSRRVAEFAAAGDAVGGGLEEVGVADRAGFDDSREDDEELENNAASEDDESDQAEDGTLEDCQYCKKLNICASWLTTDGHGYGVVVAMRKRS
jgi:hypothetical protein